MPKPYDKPGTREILNISGGKDSTAMYLVALEQGVDFLPVFADTGNEHPATLDYVHELAARTGGPAVRTVKADLSAQFPARREAIRVKWAQQGVPPGVIDRAVEAMQPTGIPFLDVCMLRSGFPSARMRFCTDRLKIQPILEQVYGPIWEAGDELTSWQGVRADESRARRHLPMWQHTGMYAIWRPLMHWREADVWRRHRRHGLEPNPLYAHGVKRVGCMPCIMVSKAELRIIAERWPEHIDRVRAWECAVGQATKRTISAATMLPPRSLGRGESIDVARHGIDESVRWANTSRGGRQFALPFDTPIRPGLTTTCDAWGACE